MTHSARNDTQRPFTAHFARSQLAEAGKDEDVNQALREMLMAAPEKFTAPVVSQCPH